MYNSWNNVLKLIGTVTKWVLVWPFLLAMVIGGIGSGIWTLLPTELVGWGAITPNYLGYVSHCSFAPFSSLMLFLMAAVGLVLIYKFWGTLSHVGMEFNKKVGV